MTKAPKVSDSNKSFGGKPKSAEQSNRGTKVEPSSVNGDSKGKFGTEIFKLLSSIGKSVLPVPRVNSPVNLGELFLWTEIMKFAEKRKDALWKDAIVGGHIVVDGLDPGEHELLTQGGFISVADVSNPVKRFSADEMVRLIVKETKLSLPKAVAMVAAAKVPTKSTVTKKVIERTV